MIDQNKVKPTDNVEELLRFIGYKRTEAEKIRDEEVLKEFTERLKKEGYSLPLMNQFAGRLREAGYDPNYIAGAIAVLLGRRAEEAKAEYTLERLIRLTEKMPKNVAEELSKVSLYTTSRDWAAEANIDLSKERPHPEHLGYYPEGADTVYRLPDSSGIATLYLDDLKHSYELGTYLSKIRYPFKNLWIKNPAQPNAYLHIQIAKGDITTQGIEGAGLCIARTTTPLGVGATYTSGIFSAISYSRVSIEALADQASAANGLRIQQSIDGRNWDYEDNWTLVGGTGQCQAVERMGQHIRIQLINGGVAQSVLRLAAFVR